MKNLKNFIARLSFFTIILFMGTASQNATTSNAEGQLTVAGNTVQIQHAYAIAQPGYFDKNNEDIVVIVTNIPLSDKAVEEEWTRNAMVRDGTLKSVEVTINSKQQPISVSIKHPAFKASPSGFSSNYILELKTFNENNVEGRMYCKSEQEFFDTVYTFDFTFKVEVWRKKELPPPTEAEKEAAANSPQAVVYLEFVKALYAGDVKKLKKVMTASVAKELDAPDNKEMLEFMKMVTPPKAEFQRLTVDGESVTLILNAQHEGQELKGTVEFIKEDGQWKVNLSNWEEK